MAAQHTMCQINGLHMTKIKIIKDYKIRMLSVTDGSWDRSFKQDEIIHAEMEQGALFSHFKLEDGSCIANMPNEVFQILPEQQVTECQNNNLVDARNFVGTIAVNVDNERLSDADFRQFIRNSLEVVDYVGKPTQDSSYAAAFTTEDEEWHEYQALEQERYNELLTKPMLTDNEQKELESLKGTQ